MVRVGIGKPRLAFVPGHNDMSHYIPSHWTTNDFFFMQPYDYLEKRAFDIFNMKPEISPDEIDRITAKIRSGETIEWHESPWAYEMNRLIKLAGGHQLWQFNVVSKDLESFQRQVIVLGGNDLCQWTFFDAYIKLPILKLSCKILNRLNKRRADREWREWQAFLDSLKEKGNDQTSNRAT